MSRTWAGERRLVDGSSGRHLRVAFGSRFGVVYLPFQIVNLAGKYEGAGESRGCRGDATDGRTAIGLGRSIQ
jgi:hypothetical protein